MGSAQVRCTYCGGRGGDGALLEADVRGVRYDYCDAACATAHWMAVELTALLCPSCDEDAVGDTGVCAEHLEAPESQLGETSWRRAG
jgi:hypothetical protein